MSARARLRIALRRDRCACSSCSRARGGRASSRRGYRSSACARRDRRRALPRARVTFVARLARRHDALGVGRSHAARAARRRASAGRLGVDRRKLPGTLVVSVVENMPVALVPTARGFLRVRRARAPAADRPEPSRGRSCRLRRGATPRCCGCSARVRARASAPLRSPERDVARTGDREVAARISRRCRFAQCWT